MKLDLPLVPVGEEVEIFTPATATGRCSDLGQAPATMEFLLQPLNRTFLEEVNDNNGAMEPVRFPVSAVAEVEDPAPAASSADGQICGAEAAGADMAQCSEHSMEQIDPKTPGRTQRVHVGAAALRRPPCPDRVTALEKTDREFAEHPGDIVMVPKIGTNFDTLGEAYDF